MPQRISGRVALLIIVVATLVVILVGWIGFVSPQRSKASSLSGEISNTELQIADNQKLAAGPIKRQSLAALRKLQTAVPELAKQPQLLRQLSSMARTSDTELDSIAPAVPLAGTSTESLPLTVILKGHYFAIQRFLRLMRASSDLRNGHLVGRGRLFTVDNISFATGSGGTGSSPGVITATLAINAFLSAAAPPAGCRSDDDHHGFSFRRHHDRAVDGRQRLPTSQDRIREGGGFEAAATEDHGDRRRHPARARPRVRGSAYA